MPKETFLGWVFRGIDPTKSQVDQSCWTFKWGLLDTSFVCFIHTCTLNAWPIYLHLLHIYRLNYQNVGVCVYIYFYSYVSICVYIFRPDIGQMIRVSACPFLVGLQRSSSTLVFQIVKYLQSRPLDWGSAAGLVEVSNTYSQARTGGCWKTRNKFPPFFLSWISSDFQTPRISIEEFNGLARGILMTWAVLHTRWAPSS